MKSKKVWKYFCEFCGKGNCNPSYMSRHEKGCTMNPARVCRMCARVGDKQAPIADLIASISYTPVPGFEVDKVDEFLDGSRVGLPAMSQEETSRLRTLANNCPACILAALRQRSEPEDGIYASNDEWNWGVERKAWIDDYRESCEINPEGDQWFERSLWDAAREKRYGRFKARATR